jgi:hypothetical protein
VKDGDEDLDADGLTVLKELELGTDPKAPDSDADGLMMPSTINTSQTIALKETLYQNPFHY